MSKIYETKECVLLDQKIVLKSVLKVNLLARVDSYNIFAPN